MDSGKGEDCPELSIPQFHNPQPGDENVGNLLWVSIIHLLILHIPYRAFLSQDSIGRVVAWALAFSFRQQHQY